MVMLAGKNVVNKVAVAHLGTLLATKVLWYAIPGVWQTHFHGVIEAYHSNFMWLINRLCN